MLKSNGLDTMHHSLVMGIFLILIHWLLITSDQSSDQCGDGDILKCWWDNLVLVGSLAPADRSPPPPSHKYECQFQECFPSSQLVTGPNIALQLSSEPDICPAHFYTVPHLWGIIFQRWLSPAWPLSPRNAAWILEGLCLRTLWPFCTSENTFLSF